MTNTTASIKKQARALYSRIILNRTTTAFFVFTFVFCLSQGIIQSFFFSVDSEYEGLLRGIISIVEPDSLAYNLTFIPTQINFGTIPLRLCDDVAPAEQMIRDNCSIIFDTAKPIVPPSQTIVMNGVRFDQREVEVRGKDSSSTSVSKTCAQTLLYAHEQIRSFTSEDLTFIVLQFWLFGISLVASKNDSAPHLWTVLIARALVTAWSIYSLWRTENLKVIFRMLYADGGSPCHIDFFSLFFARRLAYGIPDVVLNVIGLLIVCWLSWDLLRMYNVQAMGYLGAPEHINRINKLFLAILSCLQLEVFILVTAMGLWIDVLKNTAINRISEHTTSYLGGFIFTSIVLVPWICLGWYSIRREMKKTVLLFFFLALALTVGWSAMFYSLVYRWSLIHWPLLAGLTCTSLVLVVSSTVLTIICRLNFGRGLKQYLEAEAALAKSGFSPEVFRHDEEKNAPFDLDIPDSKESLSPTLPETKYEQPMPTYLAQQTGASAASIRKADAQGAPLGVSRLAERPANMSAQGPLKYGVNFGQSL